MKRYIHLTIGILLYSIGIVLSVNANLGLAPWDVFHQGLANISPFTFGQISIIIGFILIIINFYLKEKIGLGTIVNMIFIGLFIDIIFKYNLLPISSTMLSGIIMLFISMFTIAIATYFYIGARLGTGPRDGLMIAIKKISCMKIGYIRGGIEISVLIVGYLLGGKIGIGTAIMAFSIGPIIQITFKVLNFEVDKINYDYISFNFKLF